MENKNMSYSCNDIRIILYKHLEGVDVYVEKMDRLAQIIKSLSPDNQAGLAVAIEIISEGQEM